MWRGQVYAVEALGLPSDRVENMHTSHPDEPPGNTLFHHSFLVVYQRMIAGQPTSASILHGIVHNGAGKTVRLLRNDAEVAQATVGADQRFRFEGLGAGQYVVQVVGTGVASAAITLDGQNSVEIELTVPTALATIEGWVHRGAGHTVLALKDGATEMARSTVAADESFLLQDLDAGTYVVAVEGTGVFSQPVVLTAGASELLELTLPEGGGLPVERPLLQYVLLGPAGASGERTNFLLAADYIARFRLAFGYSLLDAHQAARVTIIGDGYGPVGVADLVSEGIRVEQINGGPDAVRAALAARIANGQS